MSHFVFCWEMGGGMGHLVPLALLASRMQASGHRVTFVSSDLTHAARYLANHGIPWLQAPRLRPAHRPIALNNHADILKTSGYDNEDRLHALVGGWKALFELLRPAKIICEYAPTAQLAARSMRIPCVCIDNGFSMPPVADPMPPLREDLPISATLLRESEMQVLNTINSVMHKTGGEQLPRFSALYEAEVWYRNWPEFNHFGPHSPDRHLGQIFGESEGVAPVWPQGKGRKIFAYIKADNPFGMPLLKAAAEQGFRILAYLPGYSATMVEELTRTNRIFVSPEPVRLSALEEDIDIGIWQSPTGGVGHSLDKGMRMIFLPSQVEQFRACRAVERSGVPAHVVLQHEDWKSLLENLLAKPRMTINQRFAPADVAHFAAILMRMH